MLEENIQTRWQNDFADFSLGKAETHIWKIAIDIETVDLGRFANLLAPDEIERANRYRFLKDKAVYSVTRGSLRWLLGRYLDRHPLSIGLSANDYGKPRLESQASESALKFNVSHSGRIALIALNLDSEIGIDVETMERDVSFLDLAESHFSKNEHERIESQSDSRLRPFFYNCWVRKEAYVKAIGKGLSIPLDSFSVSVENAPHLERVRLDTIAGQANALGIFALHIDEPDYVAALAQCERNSQIRCLALDTRRPLAAAEAI